MKITRRHGIIKACQGNIAQKKTRKILIDQVPSRTGHIIFIPANRHVRNQRPVPVSVQELVLVSRSRRRNKPRSAGRRCGSADERLEPQPNPFAPCRQVLVRRMAVSPVYIGPVRLQRFEHRKLHNVLVITESIGITERLRDEQRGRVAVIARRHTVRRSICLQHGRCDYLVGVGNQTLRIAKLPSERRLFERITIDRVGNAVLLRHHINGSYAVSINLFDIFVGDSHAVVIRCGILYQIKQHRQIAPQVLERGVGEAVVYKQRHKVDIRFERRAVAARPLHTQHGRRKLARHAAKRCLGIQPEREGIADAHIRRVRSVYAYRHLAQQQAKRQRCIRRIFLDPGESHLKLVSRAIAPPCSVACVHTIAEIELHIIQLDGIKKNGIVSGKPLRYFRLATAHRPGKRDLVRM